jgi:CheY-like chemotaxis protein
MGGNEETERRSILIAVDDPERAGDVAAFLERLDYDTSLVDAGNVEAAPPEAWPDRLALTALEHFLAAWRRANPDVGVRIENAGVLDRANGG